MKWPKGLLLFLALAVATEMFAFSGRRYLVDDYWNQFILNERHVIGLEGDFDYLLIGNSIQKTGIDPLEVDDRLVNLGLPGGKPMEHYLLLKRYLERHEAPKAIFLFLDPEDQEDSLYVSLRYFFTLPEFIAVWDDLNWKERKIFLGRYFATLDLRKVGLVIRDGFEGTSDDFARSLKTHRGFMSVPHPARELEDPYFESHPRRVQDKISFSKRDGVYFKKFMDLASRHNIRIVFLGLLVPRELSAKLEASGFLGEYRTLLRQMKLKYPQSVFSPEPVIVMEHRFFSDSNHMNQKGVRRYTRYFEDEIFRPFVRGLAASGGAKP